MAFFLLSFFIYFAFLKMSDYYSILEVPRTATAEEIRAAYKLHALSLHPDKNPSGELKFKELQSAYQVLKSPSKRRTYDMTFVTTTSPRPQDEYFPCAPRPGLSEWLRRCHAERDRARAQAEEEERAQQAAEESAAHATVERERARRKREQEDFENQRREEERRSAEERAKREAVAQEAAAHQAASASLVDQLYLDVVRAREELRREREAWVRKQKEAGLDADTSYAGWDRRVAERERLRKVERLKHDVQASREQEGISSLV